MVNTRAEEKIHVPYSCPRMIRNITSTYMSKKNDSVNLKERRG